MNFENSYKASLIGTIGLIVSTMGIASIVTKVIPDLYSRKSLNVSIPMGILILVIGIILIFSAYVISQKEYEAKLDTDLETAKQYIEENPESKEEIMKRNEAYYNYVTTGQEAIDNMLNKGKMTKKERRKLFYKIADIIMYIVIPGAFIIVILVEEYILK